MPCIELTLDDHISYFKDCIYDSYIRLDVSDENGYNLMKNKAIIEAIDDIRTEPLILGDYDFDMVMDYAKNNISFNEYIDFKNKWE